MMAGEPRHSEFLPYLLNRVAGQLNAPMQKVLRRRGMTLTHWRILGFLCERDELIISELADRSVTDHATLSRALDRLQVLGMVQRVVDRDDSRQFRVHLLDPGRLEYQQLTRYAMDVQAWAFGGLTPQAGEQLRSALQVLSQSMAIAPPPESVVSDLYHQSDEQDEELL